MPIIDDGAGDPNFKVVYSERIDNLREGDQFRVDARTMTRIGSVDYNVELPTEVIVAKQPDHTRSAGVAVYTEPSSQVSELNGVNCTQAASAHQTPCARDKLGVFEISQRHSSSTSTSSRGRRRSSPPSTTRIATRRSSSTAAI